MRTTGVTLPKLEITRLGWLAYGLGLVTVVVDHVSKSAMLGLFARTCSGFAPHPDSFCRIVTGGPVNLTMVWNQGMSFGLGRSHPHEARWVFAAFAVAVAGLLAWWASRTDRRLFAAASGFLIGGALGNVFDRFRYGAVVDFIDVSPIFGRLFPWVFNVADSAITVGAALLLAEAFLPGLRSRLDSRPETGN